MAMATMCFFTQDLITSASSCYQWLGYSAYHMDTLMTVRISSQGSVRSVRASSETSGNR